MQHLFAPRRGALVLAVAISLAGCALPIPIPNLGPDGTTGWRAIQAAEAEYRETYGARVEVAQTEGAR